MGEYLTKLFPSPESMPDGDHWKIACDLADQALAGENVTATDWEDSSCDWGESETKIYGFLQTLHGRGVRKRSLLRVQRDQRGQREAASHTVLRGTSFVRRSSFESKFRRRTHNVFLFFSAIVGTSYSILGAVPDGAIVLFSGLGQDAQNQISVGVGALAGSTIMLLTIPWFLSIFRKSQNQRNRRKVRLRVRSCVPGDRRGATRSFERDAS